ncbi:MAG: DUF1761 domain-containing protein [Paludibacter sp.]
MNITTLFSEINWLAVILVIILSFVLGALWHSKLLFGKAWSEDSKTKYNSDYHGNPLVVFGLSALLHTVAVIGLAMFIGRDSNALAGMLKGLVISTAWISTSIGVTYIFVGHSFRLFLIDAGFYVVFLSLAGLILGVW